MKHGGDLTAAKARWGGGDPAWLDLSTGINPHPWPIPDGHLRRGLSRLPSQEDLGRLLAAARAAYAVPHRLDIVAAPGTQALIQWLPRLAPSGYAPSSVRVGIVGPTYSEHALAWRAGAASVAEIAHLAGSPDDAPHLVLVNPNNPDGRLTPTADILCAAERCAKRGGWLIVDESFVDTEPDASVVPWIGDRPIVVLRSFGKFYGLAGLRLGFAIAPPRLAEGLAEALGPWAVSGPALAIGAAALADQGWGAAMRRRLAEESRALDAALAETGVEIIGGTSLYRLIRHPRAAALHAALAAEHVWVRRFDWADDLLRFGLPPDPDSLERLRAVLARAVRRP